MRWANRMLLFSLFFWALIQYSAVSVAFMMAVWCQWMSGREISVSHQPLLQLRSCLKTYPTYILLPCFAAILFLIHVYHHLSAYGAAAALVFPLVSNHLVTLLVNIAHCHLQMICMSVIPAVQVFELLWTLVWKLHGKTGWSVPQVAVGQ